jgi:uncharacterized membrane protein YuzA (DUF378 family)
METNGWDWLAVLLVIVGALNWGVIGITGLMGDPTNAVEVASETVFQPGIDDTVGNLVYVLVGLAGIYHIYIGFKMFRSSRRDTRRAQRATEQQQQTEQQRTE